jgi:hypothetical protein
VTNGLAILTSDNDARILAFGGGLWERTFHHFVRSSKTPSAMH